MAHAGARLSPRWRSLADPAWLEGWEPHELALRGGSTEVVTLGSGPSVLLLPPLPGFKEAFVGVARLLAPRFRVTTFDLRVRFDGPPVWEPLLEDLDRVVESAASGRVTLVGHSLGGALAQRWALARPHRVRALVLSSSFARVGSVRGHGWRRYVEQPLVLAGQRWLPERVARPLARRLAARGAWVYDTRCDSRALDVVRCAIRSVPMGAARRAVQLALRHDARADLDRLGGVPTLLIVGERETRWARAAEAELAALLPHAERCVAPGVGHLHPLSDPEGFARTVGEWLEAR
jgi:pimeloyl-ACP methyl ester carboxylesterase